MTSQIAINRRHFLQYSGIGLAALAGMPGWLRAMEKKHLNVASANFHPDVELELYARPASVGVLPGTLTNVQKYFGALLKGPADTLAEIPGTYLGPVLRFHKGQKVRVHFRNELDEPCITHWHGLHVPHLSDGHPMYAIDKGEAWVYEFEVLNRAGTYFYHPHTHGMTGKQVYQGLSGMILVEDEEEKKLGLPSGEYEVPLVIQDRSFDGGNQLLYLSHNMQRMMGFHGDRILINGKPDFELPVASRAYRLRIANGSNSRIYKLAWDDGTPITVIGVDGGLLETPATKPYVMMGPGERIDVWADFSGCAVGSERVMRSKPFSGALPPMHERMAGMMGQGMMGMMPGMKLPQGSDYPLFKARIVRAVSDSPKLPEKLCAIGRYAAKDTANADRPVPIGISEGMMSMLLNGRPFKMDDVQPFEQVKVNTLQLLEIFHAHGMGASGSHGGETQPAPEHAGAAPKDAGMGGMGHGPGGGMGMMGRGMGMMGGMKHDAEPAGPEGKGGMDHGQGGGMGGMGMMGGGGMSMSMAHPIHIHGQQFQILSRSLDMKEGDGYDTVKDGFVDTGWKDVVLVMPGERVKIIKPFDNYTGLFTYHCHNLEHEDLGMMRDFLVA
jgi:FtsP/CotA-like multicopper oxidase with cupredoxin domain